MFQYVLEALGFRFRPASVYQRVLELMGEGYEVSNSDASGGFILATKRQFDRTDTPADWSQSTIQGIRVSDNQCTVRFIEEGGTVGEAEKSVDRDSGLEWALIQQMEPERATAIEVRAEKKMREIIVYD